MDPGHAMPVAVLQIIKNYVWEFHRADAIERYTKLSAESHIRSCIGQICEDIRHNTPTYQFNILTSRNSNLRLRLFLPDCNPNAMHTGLRIPESHIVSIQRRSLSLHPANMYPAAVEFVDGL